MFLDAWNMWDGLAAKRNEKIMDGYARAMSDAKLNNTFLNNFIAKFKSCLPIGYEAILLEETQNDIACAWRKLRVCYRGKHLDISVTPEYDYNLNHKEISDKFIHQICEFLDRKEMKPKGIKITREEAVNKVINASSREPGKGFIDALEALGLLKFEEEKDTRVIVIQNAKIPTELVCVEISKAIEVLKQAGYKVDKL